MPSSGTFLTTLVLSVGAWNSARIFGFTFATSRIITPLIWSRGRTRSKVFFSVRPTTASLSTIASVIATNIQRALAPPRQAMRIKTTPRMGIHSSIAESTGISQSRTGWVQSRLMCQKRSRSQPVMVCDQGKFSRRWASASCSCRARAGRRACNRCRCPRPPGLGARPFQRHP